MFELKLDTTVENPDEVSVSAMEAVQRELPKIAMQLAMMAHGEIAKEANRKLHSSRRLYVENLTFQQDGPGTWVVELLPPAHWIENGRNAGSMVDDLLSGGKVKYGPNGRYKVIPFHHNRPPTQMTESQNNLRQSIREVFKELGKPWGNPSQIAERDRAGGMTDGWGQQFGNPDGPKLTPALRRLTTTRIDKLDIMDRPVRQADGAIAGAGRPQGWGPQGEAIQGPTGIPYLQGLKVYQSEIKTTSGNLVTQKDIMSFRTVSEKHKDEGRWEHPGFEAKRFFDPAYQKIKNEWETNIKPGLEARLKQE